MGEEVVEEEKQVGKVGEEVEKDLEKIEEVEEVLDHGASGGAAAVRRS